MSNADVDGFRAREGRHRGGESPGARADLPFHREVRRRLRAADLLLLAGVPLLLAALFALPRETRLALAFQQADPTLLTAFAAHYVHLSADHLAANVLGYLLLAPLVYLLCLLNGHRRLFRAAATTFLLAFPFALSGLELAVGRNGVALGFSGINGAFFGLLAFALARYAGGRFGERFDATDAAPAFFVGAAIIATLAVRSTTLSAGIAAAALLSGALYSETVLGDVGIPSPDAVRAAASQPGYFELAGAGFGLFLAYPFVAFPGTVVTDGGVVNLYVHLLGFCLAFIVTYVATLLGSWETADISTT